MTSSTRDAIRSVVEEFVREELSQENAHIAGAVWSMLDAGGKGLRPQITMLAALACDREAVEDPLLASYMELIHLATLIHDDVVDEANIRRGRTSLNSAQGNRFSVLAGDYLFAWVFKKITQSYDPPVPTILAAMLSEICNGEVKQLRATGNLSLAQEQYFEIIGKKTAQLFAACAESGAIVALQRKTKTTGLSLRDDANVRALRDYGFAFGLAFQIRDDVLDVVANETALGKPAASDLRERKVTLPLILALEHGDEAFCDSARQLFSGPALDEGKAPTGSEATNGLASQRLQAVVTHLRSPAAVERCREVIRRYAEQARRALSALPQSEATAALAALTNSLSEFSF
jgi:octaprenyl-diphosphate synthase